MSTTVQSGSGIKSQPPVPLNEPPHEIERKRKLALLAQVKTLRESILLNKGAVEGNSAKIYCWVNIREDRRAYYEALGWQLCIDEAVKTRWKQADGTHKRADLILYEIDRELGEAIIAYNSLRGIEAVDGSEEMFLSALDRNKVPVYRPAAK